MASKTSKSAPAFATVANFTPKGPRMLHVSPRGDAIVGFTDTYKGKDYINIRICYKTQEGLWAPTGKGISVPADQQDAFFKALTGFVATLTNAAAHAKKEVAPAQAA